MWELDYECIWITVESTVCCHEPTCCYFPFFSRICPFRDTVSNWYMSAGADIHLVNELTLGLLQYFLLIPLPIVLSRTLWHASEYLDLLRTSVIANNCHYHHTRCLKLHKLTSRTLTSRTLLFLETSLIVSSSALTTAMASLLIQKIRSCSLLPT